MLITIQEEWAHTGIDCNDHQLQKQMTVPLKFVRLSVAIWSGAKKKKKLGKGLFFILTHNAKYVLLNTGKGEEKETWRSFGQRIWVMTRGTIKTCCLDNSQWPSSRTRVEFLTLFPDKISMTNYLIYGQITLSTSLNNVNLTLSWATSVCNCPF